MALKTYSHLARHRRIPTEYEIVSSQLLTYPALKAEVNTPLSRWVEKHQSSSIAAAVQWQGFNDPRQTTYRSYVQLRHSQETYLTGLLDGMPPDERYSQKEWRHVLDVIVGPIRYPCHGFSMLAAYVGHLAPEGKITICCAFQVADEIRRIERFAAYYLKGTEHHEGLALRSRHLWESYPAWQPLRQIIEEMLVPDDWFRRLVSLNLVLRPLFDRILLARLAQFSRQENVDTLRRTIDSLLMNGSWHWEWTTAAVEHALSCDAAIAADLKSEIEYWVPRTQEAMLAAVKDIPDICEGNSQGVIESTYQDDYDAALKRFGVDITKYFAQGMD